MCADWLGIVGEINPKILMSACGAISGVWIDQIKYDGYFNSSAGATNQHSQLH